MAEERAPYEFTAVECTLACLSSLQARQALLQWNLDTVLKIHRFRFGGKLTSADHTRFIQDFMYSPQARAALNISGGNPVQRRVSCQRLNTTAMRMDFFDALTEAGIVTAAGTIRGCLDETFDGITVTDCLREMLANPDSEHSCVYGDRERSEFLFHVFKLLVLGGAMCQADTNMERYLQMTKDLYKELLTVYRNSKTSAVEVGSVVYQVTEVEELQLFPHDSPHNALYLVIDPIKHTVTMLYKPFIPFW